MQRTRTFIFSIATGFLLLTLSCSGSQFTDSPATSMVPTAVPSLSVPQNIDAAPLPSATPAMTPTPEPPVLFKGDRLFSGGQQICVITIDGLVTCLLPTDIYNQQSAGGFGNEKLLLTISGLDAGAQTLAVGDPYSCASLKDNGVKCWRTDDEKTSYQPTDIPGLSGFYPALFMHGTLGCALADTGQLLCWTFETKPGQDGNPIPLVQAPVEVRDAPANIQALTWFNGQFCVLAENHALVCWGKNPAEDSPATYSGLPVGILAVASGASHDCLLSVKGEVFCLGKNIDGQLGAGEGAGKSSKEPLLVTGLDGGVTSIASGNAFSCALKAQGGVQCWGSNDWGELGRDILEKRFTPVDMPDLESGVKSLAASSAHACALLQDGTVRCWGSFGTFPPQRFGSSAAPAEIAATLLRQSRDWYVLTEYLQAVAPGLTHTCAILIQEGAQADKQSFYTESKIKCWGKNQYGQLGDGTQEDSPTPVQVVSTMDYAYSPKLALGENHTCATVYQGVICWGRNDAGQLGDGTAEDRSQPVRVTGLPVPDIQSSIMDIVANGNHTCVLTTDRKVYCWGDNTYGQLGDGTTTNPASAVPVVGLEEGVYRLVLGRDHTCAYTDSNAIYCWGRNQYGQLGDGTFTDRSTPATVQQDQLHSANTSLLTAGFNHTCVIALQMGCWGSNQEGQIGFGEQTSQNLPIYYDWTSPEPFDPNMWAAGNVTCTTDNGNFLCWGDNTDGQLGNGTTGGSVDFEHAVPVRNLPNPLSPSTMDLPIYGNGNHLCYFLVTRGGAWQHASSVLKCWGDNEFGQLGDGTTTDRNAPVDISVGWD